eukprot:11067522-Alexandrium_andersonii.AAC.1
MLATIRARAAAAAWGLGLLNTRSKGGCGQKVPLARPCSHRKERAHIYVYIHPGRARPCGMVLCA